MKRILELLRRKGIAKETVAEISAELEKPPLSPWWNSRERWEHELGIKSKNDYR